MDNITHSLVGVAVAEGVMALKGSYPPPRRRRLLLWISSVLGGNFPDIDFLWAKRMGPHDLGYLLHHRGHTHTVLLGIPTGFLIYAFVCALARLKKWDLSRREKQACFGLAVLGPQLHILLDYLNSYGVHPFWPWDNRWFYGDTLFIIEPIIWISLLIPVFYVSKNKWFRGAILGFCMGALVLSLWAPMIPLAAAVFLMVLIVALLLFYWWLPVRQHFLFGLAFFGGLVAVYFLVSQEIKTEFKRLYTKMTPGIRLHDVVLSPLPVNPFCWRVWAIEAFDTKVSYKVRRGTVAPFPLVQTAPQCARLLDSDLDESIVGTNPRLVWYREEEFSRPVWDELQAKHCEARAFLIYSRVPGYEKLSIDQYNLHDLRFDFRQRSSKFTEVPLGPENSSCDMVLPPWSPPRVELLMD